MYIWSWNNPFWISKFLFVHWGSATFVQSKQTFAHFRFNSKCKAAWILSVWDEICFFKAEWSMPNPCSLRIARRLWNAPSAQIPHLLLVNQEQILLSPADCVTRLFAQHPSRSLWPQPGQWNLIQTKNDNEPIQACTTVMYVIFGTITPIPGYNRKKRQELQEQRYNY
jgi:hypothetical protein